MPAVLVSPASVAKRSGANQFDTSLSVAMNEKAAPAPMTRRARLAVPAPVAPAKSRLPSAATPTAAASGRCGPKRSTVRPTGICSSA